MKVSGPISHPRHRDVRFVSAANAANAVCETALDLEAELSIKLYGLLIALARDQFDAQYVGAVLRNLSEQLREQRLPDVLPLRIWMNRDGQFSQNVSEDFGTERVR